MIKKRVKDNSVNVIDVIYINSSSFHTAGGGFDDDDFINGDD